MSESFAYLNGRIVPAAQAALPVWDAGVVLGATVSEQTRTFQRRPFRLGDHLDRLDRSLRAVRIVLGVARAELEAISHDLIARNGADLGPGDDLGLIHFATAGALPWFAPGPVMLGPTLGVHTFPLPFIRWAESMRRGQHLVVPSVRHLPAACLDPTVKCRSRMHWFLADQEARLVDPAAAALLLDLKDHVTETSSANFFLVERGTVVTPPAADVLPGISRAATLELATRLGLHVVERPVPLDDVLSADEAFTTSTPYCLMPVTKVNGRAIGDGRPGPVTRRLLAAWSDEVGLDVEKQIVEGAERARLR